MFMLKARVQNYANRPQSYRRPASVAYWAVVCTTSRQLTKRVRIHFPGVLCYGITELSLSWLICNAWLLLNTEFSSSALALLTDQHCTVHTVMYSTLSQPT